VNPLRWNDLEAARATPQISLAQRKVFHTQTLRKTINLVSFPAANFLALPCYLLTKPIGLILKGDLSASDRFFVRPSPVGQMLKRLQPGTDVEATDDVVLYATFGRAADSGHWKIDVCGTVYGAGSVSLRKRLLLRLLQRVAKVQPTEAQRELFEQRIRAFVAPTERGKRVALRVADRVHTLQRRTRRNGQFRGSIRLSPADLDMLRDCGDLRDGLIKLDVLSSDGRATRSCVHAHLLDHEGISVISDIDDTIKVTDVHCRRALLENTFLREYETIDGMADVYRQWAQRGIAFHYVSSSPWQLYNSLAEMCQSSGFPGGSFHLRSFRLRDHMLRRILLIRRKGKAAVIRSLLKMFPRRQFILVGDSGEADPEIYAKVARKRRHQVAAIFIRQFPGRPLSTERMQKLYHELPAGTIRVFTCPSELPRDPAENTVRLATVAKS